MSTFRTSMSNWTLGCRRIKDMALLAMLMRLNMLRVALTQPPFMIHLFTRCPLPTNHWLQQKIFDNLPVVA